MHRPLNLFVSGPPGPAQTVVFRPSSGQTNDEIRDAAKELSEYLTRNVSWVFVGSLVAYILCKHPTIAQDAKAYLAAEKPRAQAFRKLKAASEEQVSAVLQALSDLP